MSTSFEYDSGFVKHSIPVKLNIGDAGIDRPGWTGIDIKRGHRAERLRMADNSADEVRASHILEHFSHKEVPDVLAEWVRVLKPGGLLKIAVPDFKVIAQQFLAGDPIPYEGYVMGGHVDHYDFHKALFTEESLRKLFDELGIEDVQRWGDDGFKDFSCYAISLNLCGIKGPRAVKRPERLSRYKQLRRRLRPLRAWLREELAVQAGVLRSWAGR